MQLGREGQVKQRREKGGKVALVPIEGTPMNMPDMGEPPDVFQMARTIATARIIMPRSMVRLSAGRLSFSPIEQAVMFLAGANSIFTGDKLLTAPNAGDDSDGALFAKLGLTPLKGEEPLRQGAASNPNTNSEAETYA